MSQATIAPRLRKCLGLPLPQGYDKTYKERGLFHFVLLLLTVNSHLWMTQTVDMINLKLLWTCVNNPKDGLCLGPTEVTKSLLASSVYFILFYIQVIVKSHLRMTHTVLTKKQKINWRWINLPKDGPCFEMILKSFLLWVGLHFIFAPRQL